MSKEQPKLQSLINRLTQERNMAKKRFDILDKIIDLLELSPAIQDFFIMFQQLNMHTLGTKDNPATGNDIDELKYLSKSNRPSDTEMLNWLQENTQGYGTGWICRDSTTGRGLRLHETSDSEAHPTVREAITEAMKNGI